MWVDYVSRLWMWGHLALKGRRPTWAPQRSRMSCNFLWLDSCFHLLSEGVALFPYRPILGVFWIIGLNLNTWLNPAQIESYWWDAGSIVGRFSDVDSQDLCLNFSNCTVTLGRFFFFNFSCLPFPHLETRGLEQVVPRVPIRLGSRDLPLHDLDVTKHAVSQLQMYVRGGAKGRACSRKTSLFLF